jgi:hypothetical protein
MVETTRKYVRAIRAPFVLALSIAGYISLMKVATGGSLAILTYLLIPFMLLTFAEGILDVAQLASKKKT